MSKMLQSRRRLLGFLGLMGAPLAVWSPPVLAQTAAPPVVTCDVDDGSYKYFIHYTQNFEISDGTMAPSDGEALVKVDLRPSQITFKPPYSAAQYGTVGYVDPITGGGGFDGTDGSFTLSMNGTITDPSFMAYVYMPEAPAGQARVIEAQISIVGATNQLARVPVTVRALAGSQQNLSGSFSTDLNESLRNHPFDLTIVVDGKAAGSYRYDFTQVPWQESMAFNDDNYAHATDVTVDDDGNSNFEECKASECFFTTAAVGTLGLSDDCWELRTLRAFRDGPLAQTPEGQSLTARYYAEAPRIVAGIDRRGDAQRIWLAHYWTHILPCAVMARVGAHRLAIQRYRRLFEKLEDLIKAS